MESDVVMVTGAAGNLGRAAIEEFSARGFRLACIERSPDRLDALAASLSPDVSLMKLPGVDLTDFRACQEAVRQAEARFGQIHALVNTVGGFQMHAVDEKGLDQWDALMAMNARTAYAISAAVLPGMQRAGYGRIVHVAAAPGLKAGGRQAAYAASKAAVIRLTEAIAAESRAHKITANCILPGTIDTPENRAAMPDANRDGWVSARAIARLIAYLASADGGIVTGAAIPATGV
jgi:NAD(P)-dependent dehydrogenase (short-subunit alcohol dehydrogenase family)